MFYWMRCLNYCLIWNKKQSTWFCSLIWELICLRSWSWCSRPNFWMDKELREGRIRCVRHWWFSYHFWCRCRWLIQWFCWCNLSYGNKIPLARARNRLAKSAEKLSLILDLMKLFMVALGICYPSIFGLKDLLHFIINLILFIGVNWHWSGGKCEF